MDIENPPLLNAREAEILMEPQTHIGEVRDQLARMITDLRDETYLSPGKEAKIIDDAALGKNWMNKSGTGDYHVQTHFGVRLGNGEMANLKIGATRFSDSPSEAPIEYFVDFEESNKLVYLTDSHITTVPKYLTDLPRNRGFRTSDGKIRRQLISPADFVIVKGALDAAERKTVIEETARFAAK